MSELNPVRIAVIGAGAMGRNHIRFVTEEPEAELVAIADAFEGARATAEAAGVPFFTDPAQMMDEVKPEAVIIATPNDLHLGVAREAVKRNIVPLVEKPISNDLEDAQAFAAEAETAGVPVLVGQHRRHNPFVNKAKEIIESGELGKLTVSSFHYMIYKNDEYFDVEWRRRRVPARSWSTWCTTSTCSATCWASPLPSRVCSPAPPAVLRPRTPPWSTSVLPMARSQA